MTPYKLILFAHASMGVDSFGVAPADGQILATLRTVRDVKMDEFCRRIRAAKFLTQFLLSEISE